MSGEFHDQHLPSLESQYSTLQQRLAEVEQTARENGSIISQVNDAIGRAGIHCAITFWEAIDQIVRERDDLKAALDAALQNRIGDERLIDVMQRRYGREARTWQANHDQRKAQRDLTIKERDERTAERDRLHYLLTEAVDIFDSWPDCAEKTVHANMIRAMEETLWTPSEETLAPFRDALAISSALTPAAEGQKEK